MCQTDGIATIRAARALFADVTPLSRDCGRLCGAKCCKPDADGQGGMILFPGEEALYDPAPDWASLSDSDFVIGGAPLKLLTCGGTCPRAGRPLSCRIFPLTPVAAEGRAAARLDLRAWPVCPLMEYGQKGLSPAFVRAAKEAAALLWRDARCRAYIEALTARLEAYRAF